MFDDDDNDKDAIKPDTSPIIETTVLNDVTSETNDSSNSISLMVILFLTFGLVGLAASAIVVIARRKYHGGSSRSNDSITGFSHQLEGDHSLSISPTSSISLVPSTAELEELNYGNPHPYSPPPANSNRESWFENLSMVVGTQVRGEWFQDNVRIARGGTQPESKDDYVFRDVVL